MRFPCPYCRHAINPRAPRPGRYKPTCPKCRKPFQLTIADDGAPQAEALADPTATVRVAPKPPPAPEVVPHLGQPPTDATVPAIAPARPNPPAGDATAPEPPRTLVGRDSADEGDFTVDPPTKLDPRQPSPRKRDVEITLPESLGGYRILREIGRGGMGTVYLAQQLSLDRVVALKVMNPTWGSNPAFVARFLREAYAAAQLAHHNIVQIYDFGKDRGVTYFSMEYVDGRTLGEIVKNDGRLDAERAVGYILQAARGLQYAHERGMIHRDIKPDNLMLNAQGVVKVADLGLVKTPGVADDVTELTPPGKVARGSRLADESITDVTRAGVAMGTPAYMAPEQARNASGVDGRADIYSLGCTLYVLLTGRPPFHGDTVMEILSQHASAPLVPPDAIVKAVPREVSALLQRMVAKRPEDRFADMGEVAQAMEEWLGLKSGGVALAEEQAARLEDCVRQFNGNVLAQARTPARLGLLVGSLAIGATFLSFGSFRGFFGALSFGVESLLATFLIGGLFDHSPLFQKMREYVLGMRWGAWLRAGLAALVCLLAAVLFGLHWVWLIATLLAVIGGAGLYYGIDRTAATQRQPALDAAEELFRSLRVRGLDEVELRRFVCKFGGTDWEEFFEELFGYEEKLKARDWWARAQKGQTRRRYAAWRDPIIAALDRRLGRRRETLDRDKLRQLEEERLIAEGASAVDARQKASAAAHRLVHVAKEIRREEQGIYTVAAETERPRRPRKVAAIMLQDFQEESEPEVAPPTASRIFGDILDVVMGPTVRMVIGLVLLAGWLAWMWQNGLIDALQHVHDLEDAHRVLTASEASTLAINAVKLPVAGFGAAIAGLIMVIAAFLPNWKAVLLMPVAALIAWLGPFLGLPDIGPVTGAQLCMAIGGLLAVIGIVIGRQP